MYKWGCTLFLLLLCLSPAYAMTNEPDGFRGIKWGDPIGLHAESLLLFGKLDGLPYYMRTEEEPYWNGQPVEVFYRFDPEKFDLVVLSFKRINDPDRFEKIYEACLALWGSPLKEINQPEIGREVLWKGASVSCRLLRGTLGSAGGTIDLWIWRNL